MLFASNSHYFLLCISSTNETFCIFFTFGCTLYTSFYLYLLANLKFWDCISVLSFMWLSNTDFFHPWTSPPISILLWKCSVRTLFLYVMNRQHSINLISSYSFSEILIFRCLHITLIMQASNWTHCHRWHQPPLESCLVDMIKFLLK